MENENYNSNLLDAPYFKMSCPNQCYKKSNEYQLWRKELINKYGKNSKQIFCDIDKIIFFNNQNLNYVACPICKLN